MSNRCYICRSTDQLSIRKHTKNFEPVYICRDCRHDQYVIYKFRKEIQPTQSPLHYITDRDTWSEKAMASYNKISNRGDVYVRN